MRHTIVAIVLLGLIGCHGEHAPEPVAVRAPPPNASEVARIDALIERLAAFEGPASDGPQIAPQVLRDGGERGPALDEYERRFNDAYAAAEELRQVGRPAFDRLLTHLDDDRQSVPFRRVLPSTVADACFCIVHDQIVDLPDDYPGSFYRVGADGSRRPRPIFMEPMLTYETIGPWLAERHNRPMAALQIDALTWVLDREVAIGAATPENEAAYIRPIRDRIAELRRLLKQSGDADLSSP